MSDDEKNANSGSSANEAIIKLLWNGMYYVDVTNPKKTGALVNITTGHTRTDIPIDTLKLALGDAYEEYRQAKIVYANFRYDPSESARPLGTDKDGLPIFDPYVAVTWRRGQYYWGEEIPAVEIPSIYKKFFRHLFPEAAARKFALDWIANMLRRRNATYLVCIGDQGVGKGVLAEIMRHLVGSENFAKVRDSAFKNRFNAQFQNKQLVAVDEFNLDSQEAQDRAKDVANDFLEIERKSFDAIEARNTASFYFMSNRYDAVNIEGSDDRRNSVIDLTDVPLLAAFTKDEIPTLFDPENIASLGRYLWNRPITCDLHTPFRGRRYEEVRYAGLRDWEMYLVDDVFPAWKSGEELSVKSLQERVKRKFPGLRSAPGRRKFEQVLKKFPEFHLTMSRPTKGSAGGDFVVRPTAGFQERPEAAQIPTDTEFDEGCALDEGDL